MNRIEITSILLNMVVDKMAFSIVKPQWPTSPDVQNKAPNPLMAAARDS